MLFIIGIFLGIKEKCIKGSTMQKIFFNLSIIVFLFNFSSLLCSIDLIVFSYDRPIQLYAFLESTQKYISGLEKIIVIYRTSNINFDNAYDQVKKKFPNLNYKKQHSNKPENEFKQLVIKTIFEESPSDYIIFGVDDIIVKDFINVNHCINALEKTNSYGFFLRLGKNIRQCYMHNDESTPVPNNIEISSNIFQWNFNDGNGDWKYPNSIDMTIYKKSDIKEDLTSIDFKNPSDLESCWAQKANYNLKGLFFHESKIVNIPLNIVHNEQLNALNRNGNLFSKFELLDIFNCNLKIDIDSFHKISNLAPHAAIAPKFIKR